MLNRMQRHVALLIFIISFSNGFFIVSAQEVVKNHGMLSVKGNAILDQHGDVVQLAGMSLFWSQWKGKYYNYDVVKTLRDDWKCEIVRASMGVEMGGYSEHPEKEKEKVVKVVQAAIDLGIYVIIDFHTHKGETYLPEAKTFFSEMARKFGQHPNVIYEIYNEPLADVSWDEVIKPYSEVVIAEIRKYDPDNLIVCGTRAWSQQVEEAAMNPVDDPNTAYSLHFYAGTHGQELRDIARAALDRGVALFVTEYGTTRADGDGDVYKEDTQKWWDFMDTYNLSHCCWSISDKKEGSAALKPGASKKGGWKEKGLTSNGKFVKAELQQRYNLKQQK